MVFPLVVPVTNHRPHPTWFRPRCRAAQVSATMAQRAVKFIAIERMKDRDTVESDTELDEDGLRVTCMVLGSYDEKNETLNTYSI